MANLAAVTAAEPAQCAAVELPLHELMAATDSFCEERIIGVGGFGRVFAADALPSLLRERRPARSEARLVPALSADERRGVVHVLNKGIHVGKKQEDQERFEKTEKDASCAEMHSSSAFVEAQPLVACRSPLRRFGS